jgi:hypothetical protein
MHVRVRYRGHHPPLHVGDAPLRKENHEIRLPTTAKGFDGCCARITGCRNDNGGSFAALMQNMVHQPRHKLHRQILEGERGAVEKLQDEQIRPELSKRGHCRMPEIAIGFASHAREIRLGDSISDEGPDHLDCDLGVRFPREAFDRGAIEDRPLFRHVKTAVAGQASKHDPDEIERWNFAPSGDVTH